MLTDKRVTEAQLNENGVCAAPDRLTGTAAENKAVFDRLIRQIVASCVNPVIDELASALGAAAVGAAVESMAGDNVQALLSALKTLVDDRYTKAEADALLGTNTNTLLANVALDGAGVWTFTRKDGTTVVYDTKLEKIAVNFTLDGDYLVLHHDDGTEDRVSLAAFRDHHQFADSDTVSWSWTGDENNRTFTASVRANSITLEMLALDAVAKIEADVAASGQNAAAAQDAKAQAQTAAETANMWAMDAEGTSYIAQDAADKSQSYAVGGTGTRTGEDTDNAKYYSTQAQTARTAAETAKAGSESAAQTAGQSKTAAQAAQSGAETARDAAQTSASAAKSSETNAKASETAAGTSERNAAASAQAASDSASAASESASAAKTSETAAKTSETNAKASETAAKTSETAAAGSAGSAKAEADRAKTEADRAAEIAGGDYATRTELTAHTGDKKNPHGVTATQVGADQAGSAAAVDVKLTTHAADTAKHVTSTDRQTWNSKASAAVYTVSLPASKWTGNGPYAQAVSVAGILADDRPIFGPVYAGTNDEKIEQSIMAGFVSSCETAAGSVTFTALLAKPEVDLTMQLEVIR